MEKVEVQARNSGIFWFSNEMSHSILATSALFCLLVTGVNGIGRIQSTGAYGRLTCNGKPASGVLVKLYDNDSTDIDDLMAKTYTIGDGSFHLEGWTDEFSTIDPKLNFYHDCNDEVLPCQIKFSILIPDQYITSGKVPERLFDSGVLSLDAAYPGQERDCIHFRRINASLKKTNETQI